MLDAKTTLPENLSHLGCFLNRHNTYLLFRCEGEYTNVFLVCYYIVSQKINPDMSDLITFGTDTGTDIY